MLAVLLAYVVLAASSTSPLAFAAFLAGFGIMGGMRATEHVRFDVRLGLDRRRRRRVLRPDLLRASSATASTSRRRSTRS